MCLVLLIAALKAHLALCMGAGDRSIQQNRYTFHNTKTNKGAKRKKMAGTKKKVKKESKPTDPPKACARRQGDKGKLSRCDGTEGVSVCLDCLKSSAF